MAENDRHHAITIKREGLCRNFNVFITYSIGLWHRRGSSLDTMRCLRSYRRLSFPVWKKKCTNAKEFNFPAKNVLIPQTWQADSVDIEPHGVVLFITLLIMLTIDDFSEWQHYFDEFSNVDFRSALDFSLSRVMEFLDYCNCNCEAWCGSTEDIDLLHEV